MRGDGMSDTKHTPGEWYRHGSGIYADASKRTRLVAESYAPEGRKGEMEGNAERIVLCHNCHDDLVAALKAVLACPHELDERGHQFIRVDARAINGTGAMVSYALAKAGEK